MCVGGGAVERGVCVFLGEGVGVRNGNKNPRKSLSLHNTMLFSLHL